MWENVKGMLALPDDPAQRSAAKQGLLNFGASLLAGQGNLGGILGNGLLAGSQGYQGALAQQQQAALQRAQQQRWELENKQTQAGIDRQKLGDGIIASFGAPGSISSAAGAQSPSSQPGNGAAGPISYSPGVSLEPPKQAAGYRRSGWPPAVDGSLEGGPGGTANMPPAFSAGGAPQYSPSLDGLPRKGEAPPPDLARNAHAKALQIANALLEKGLIDRAQPYFEQAKLLEPKLRDQRVLTIDGKRVMANVFDDGRTEQIMGFSPDVEKLVFADNGGTYNGRDPFTGEVKSTSVNTQSPESVAADRRAAADRKERAARAAAAAPGPDGLLPDETIEVMVDQYLAGDTSVMQNLGRGAQGAQNIVRLRNAIAQRTKAEGKTGRDLAAGNADYFGVKAGQRSAGTRIANVEMASYEAESLIPLARDASAAVKRSGLLPFGKGQVMFNEQTNDPEMRQFAAANNALVNVYSRAISPSGVPTVADKEHAREMIATAMDDRSYQAVLDQMQREITAARRAPQQVRKAFNDAVTGKGDHGPIKDVKDLPQKKAAPAAYADADKERRYQEWKRSQGK